MTNWKALATLAVLLIAVFLTQAPAQRGGKKKENNDPSTGKETGKESGKESGKKHATLKVEKRPFKIELSVKGILESGELVEVAYRPSPIIGVPYFPGPLTVRKVTAHGTKVKKGEMLVSFDTRKIDHAIGQAEQDLKLLEANIKLSEEEQPLAEKAAPVDLELAERGKREADEDLAFFLKTGKPEMEKRIDTMVKFAAFYMDYAKEQLRQLEKMYKSSDLAEDTEQIILKRQRFMVEEAINEYRLAQLDREHFLKTTLPRREQSVRDNTVKHTMALEKLRATQVPQMTQRQRSLVKMRFDRERLAGALELLQKDRTAMNVVAPADGIVYYGKFGPGHWDNAATLAGKLVPEGQITPDDVFMTIVKTRPLFLRLQLEEKDVHLVKPGVAGKAKLVFNPDLKLPARVTEVSGLPSSPGKFEARVALESGDKSELMPGMAATVHFVPYSNKQAIVVPASAVHEEDDKHFVDVLKDGKRVERQVTPGRTNDGQTEILDGLSVGEEIFPERSGDKKSAPSKGGSES